MNQSIIQRNNVKVFGRGEQPLVFAHGFGCDQNMWRYVTPDFEDDYRIVLFDYVGAGKSDMRAFRPERYGTLDGYVQDVLEIYDALQLKDSVFVGHSVSSMIGLLASIAAPDLFERLVLVGPSPRYINDPPDYVGGFERPDILGLLELMEGNYLGWASMLAPMVMKNAEHPELTQELEESFCSTDPKIANLFAQVTFLGDNRADLARVTTPSLILQCTDDSIAPTAVGDYLAQHLTQSTLRQMRATGHCPHMSHPDETIALIKDYLATAPASAVG